MDLKRELLGVVRALNRSDVPYALCGGMAVVLHGHPRLTRDVDLLIRKQDLGAAEAECPVSKADEMKAGSRGVSRDMSPDAISHRFDVLVELDRTAQALNAARKRPVRSPAPEPARRIDTTGGDG